MLNDDELLRYSRQILLPEIDIAGQEKLRAARVLIVGLGGLGSPVAMYLAAAGVGQMILVDGDGVDLSNLQRQIVHDSEQIGQAKVASAAATLRRLNPHVALELHEQYLHADAMGALVARVDVVLDCSDNFATRHCLNRACVNQGKPLVSGAAIRYSGQVSVFNLTPAAPCYACLYPELEEEAESCTVSGVLAPLVGVIGSLQALEAIKIITGIGDVLSGRIARYDGLRAKWQEATLRADPDCPVCRA